MYSKFEIFENRKFNVWLFTYSAFERKSSRLTKYDNFSKTFWKCLDTWTYVKIFNEELQAEESWVPFKSTLSEEDKVRDKDRAGYTASCLHSESYESKSHKCVYCSENRRPSQCKKVTNRQSWIDILKKSYRCFLCLKSRHALKTCSAKYICRKCNRKHQMLKT